MVTWLAAPTDNAFSDELRFQMNCLGLIGVTVTNPSISHFVSDVMLAMCIYNN